MSGSNQAAEKLKAMGLELPPAPAPVASYVPYVKLGDMVMTSGQLPTREGKLVCTGKVGGELSLEQGIEAARIAAINALAQVAECAGGIENVRRIAKLTVFVSSQAGFNDQPKVANGASDLMQELFGEAGKHARSAVGVNELPLDAPVEIEMVATVA
jgi:enamine deaminase RidA (YjgF/YER057c/UK114 family)